MSESRDARASKYQNVSPYFPLPRFIDFNTDAFPNNDGNIEIKLLSRVGLSDMCVRVLALSYPPCLANEMFCASLYKYKYKY